MTERRFDLVVFDWDGTLADSTTIIAESLQSACRDVGCRVPNGLAARYVIGLGLSDAMRHIAPDLDQASYPELSARYRYHYLAREPEIVLFDGALDLLRTLRRTGHRLAVATGKTRAGLDRALSFHGVSDHFAATRCADEGMPKPHPAMLRFLLERLDVAPDRALMIGDTTHDLEMAASAGMASVGMTHGAHGTHTLIGSTLIAKCGSLVELAQWLERESSR